MFLVKRFFPTPQSFSLFFKKPLYLTLCVTVTQKIWQIVAYALLHHKTLSLYIPFLAGSFGIPLGIYLSLASYVFFQSCLDSLLVARKPFCPCNPFLLNTEELLSLVFPSISIRSSSLLSAFQEKDS